ncbi:MAG: type II toxin-antitoxin system death-on-curing family toxin [Candidatus Acidiferrales bacterium]
MPSRFYPTVAETIEAHRLLIEEFGGIHGIRDKNLLESAIFRPQTGYYETLIDEAATLMESLANNHAFLDGNKRIAFVMTDVFLRLNGQFIDVPTTEAYQFISGSLDEGNFRFETIRRWLAVNVKSLEES